jgi:hydrogenase maturation factor
MLFWFTAFGGPCESGLGLHQSNKNKSTGKLKKQKAEGVLQFAPGVAASSDSFCVSPVFLPKGFLSTFLCFEFP